MTTKVPDLVYNEKAPMEMASNNERLSAPLYNQAGVAYPLNGVAPAQGR